LIFILLCGKRGAEDGVAKVYKRGKEKGGVMDELDLDYIIVKVKLKKKSSADKQKKS